MMWRNLHLQSSPSISQTPNRSRRPHARFTPTRSDSNSSRILNSSFDSLKHPEKSSKLGV